MKAVDEALEAAYRVRSQGDAARSEQLYSHAATLASAEGDDSLRAHALRHVSDLARERGAFSEALDAAEEAQALYRAAPGSRPLDHANALRLTALALDALGDAHAAASQWRQARALYVKEGIHLAVEECDRRLRV
jgi:hypothetical protein